QLFHALNLDHYLGLAALKPGIKPFALVRLCSFCTHHSRMCHLRRYLAGPHAKVSSDHHNLFELHWLLSHSLINRVKNTLLVFCKMLDYDVIVAGGSVSGLLAAREAAAGGLSVGVLEEDSEIGTPEHCGGLVSISGIQKLGVVPDVNAIENTKIGRAKVLSPNNGFEISAEKQNVMVLDRRALDKQI